MALASTEASKFVYRLQGIVGQTESLARQPGQLLIHGPAPQLRPYVQRLTRPGAGVAWLTILAAVLRLIGIGAQSYWYDEAHTVWVVHASFAHMFTRIETSETTPPLYFVLTWLWAHLFGYAEPALRSLSALMGIATVPVAYMVGKRAMSRRAGLIVAVLVACSPLLVWYSQEARSYSLMVLLTSIALLAFAELRIEPRRKWLIVWCAAALLALTTHYYSALAIGPEGLWLFVRYRRLSMVRIAIAVVALGATPLALLADRQLMFLGVGNNWMQHVPLIARAKDIPRTFATGPFAPSAGWLLVMAGVAVALAAYLLARRADHEERSLMRRPGALVASGALMVIALIVAGYDQLDYRNLMALWLPAVLVLAAGFGARRAGRLGLAGVLLLCVVGVTAVVGVASDPQLQRPDWRAVAAALGSSQDRAIFAVNGCQLLPLSIYLPGLRYPPASGANVDQLDMITAAGQESWYDVLLGRQYVTCAPARRAPSIPEQIRGFRLTGRPTRVGQFSIWRFAAKRDLRMSEGLLTRSGLRGELMMQARGEASSLAGYEPLNDSSLRVN